MKEKDRVPDIIDGCRKNDRKAQELLYKQFLGPMWSICLRYLGNEDDALEVLNDGYLKIFKNIAAYDASRSGLYAWMARIMINTAIDALRKKKNLHYLPMETVPEESLADTMADDCDAEELMRMINTLPETTRVVFNLFTIEEYSHKEIAAYLKISESTSRWHVTEARRRLKKIFQK